MNPRGDLPLTAAFGFACAMCCACEAIDHGARRVTARTAALESSAEQLADGGLSIEPGNEGVTIAKPQPTPDAGVTLDASYVPEMPEPGATTVTTTTTNISTNTSETTTIETTTITSDGFTSTTTTTTTVTISVTTSTTTTTTTTWDESSEAVPVATLRTRTFRCKLVNGTDNDDPTPNALHTRFNMRGTDLGVPLAVGTDLFLFFGDTAGYQTIWPIGEADAVGRIPLASVRADPTALCRELDVYVTPDDPSVAHADDPTVLRDFAGGFIIPPPGESPSRYLSLAPLNLPNVPGALEVPAGAVRSQGDVYLFYAGSATLTPFPHARSSFVSRWDDRARPGYQVLHAVDALEDGALGGHFIQIAPVATGETTYLFGTGLFRRSSIYLARTPDLEDPAATEVYSAKDDAWRLASELSQEEREALPPIVEAPGIGELSAFYVAEAGVYGLLYQRELRDREGALIDNRVLVRFARRPEGPWSEPVTISNMLDPGFYGRHCCGMTCQGEQILHCERAGLYGAYALPMFTYADGVLKLPYLVSTWDPYNVVLFEAEIVLR